MTDLSEMVSRRLKLAGEVSLYTERAELPSVDEAERANLLALARSYAAELADLDASFGAPGRDVSDPWWCEIEHAPGWPLHSRRFGQIEAEDEVGPARALVELNDYGNGKAATVSLDIFTEERFAGIEFTSAQARYAAGLLVLAADTLDAAGGGRR